MGAKQGMVLAHALPLHLHVTSIGRAVSRHLLPGHGKVTLHAVLPLQLKIGLSLPFQEGMAIPGRTVKDGCDVGGSAHGTEFLMVLVRVDGLGFVHLQQDVGRVAHHVGVGLGAEKHLARPAQDHVMPRFRAPDTAVAGVVQTFLEPVHADEGLGHEGGRGLNHVAAASHRHGEQQRRHLGGKLVLPALAGDLHGEGQAFSAGHAVHDSAAYLQLVLS